MPIRRGRGFPRTRHQLSRSPASCFEYCTGDFLSKDSKWRVADMEPEHLIWPFQFVQEAVLTEFKLLAVC
jgi:hypothetical protein